MKVYLMFPDRDFDPEAQESGFPDDTARDLCRAFASGQLLPVSQYLVGLENKRLKREQLQQLLEAGWRAAAEALLADVRNQGVAAISGNYMFRGVEAVAAPVFNFKNELTMSIVLVGVEGSIDMSAESEVLARLKGAADALSLRLGSTRDSDAAAPSAA